MGMSILGEGTACERLRGKKVKNRRKPSAAGGGVWEKARWSGRGRKPGGWARPTDRGPVCPVEEPRLPWGLQGARGRFSAEARPRVSLV